jgi:hypothetical protein
MDLEDEEKNESGPVVGPICEKCGHPTDSVYPCYVKRERRGCLEMVKIYLCAYHYFEQLEEDTEEPLPPPPDDLEEGADTFSLPEEEDEEEEEEEDYQGKLMRKKCNIDRLGQSFG